LNVVEDVKVWHLENVVKMKPTLRALSHLLFLLGSSQPPPLQSTFGETSDLHLLASAHPPGRVIGKVAVQADGFDGSVDHMSKKLEEKLATGLFSMHRI